ncbi:MAG: HEPN domain-containing protein [Prevotella sp.]|nr:HEPN domain-containing protein [Prevotella sp.]
MSLSKDDRQALVDYRIEKAYLCFEEALKVSAISLWNLAANRLYYSLYHAASALLLSDGYTSHTHKGLMSQISLNYVKDGKLLPEEGKLIRQMFNKRREGDYEDFEETTEEEIVEATPKVKALVDKMVSINHLAKK